MDPLRFDALSRALGRPHTRRTALALLAAGLLTLRGTTETTARRKKKHPCKGKPDDAPCNADGRCLSGDCTPKPACLPAGADCTTNQSGCCSGACFTGAPPFECLAHIADAGQSCQSTDDCSPGLTCLGYVCQSLTCIPTSDFCADRTAQCGMDGAALCLRSIGGGRTRCGKQSPMTCGCSSNHQCSATFGSGAFCAKFARGGACICNDKTTFCALPA